MDEDDAYEDLCSSRLQETWYEREFNSRSKRHVVEYLTEHGTTYPGVQQVAEYESSAPIKPSKKDVTQAVKNLADELGIGDAIWWSEPSRTVNGDLLRHEIDDWFEDAETNPELEYSEVQ